MFPAATTEGGVAFAVPDVCLTPPIPIPIPYPNIGSLSTTVSTATKVFVRQMPVVTVSSNIPVTSGDEAGSQGGVKSGTIKGKVAFTLGSSKVHAEGQQIVYLTAPTTQNNENAVGAVIAVVQTVVMVAT